MYQFAHSVRPYSTLPECGDFAFHKQTKDAMHLLIGDIGGHGHPMLGETVLQLKKLYESCFEANLTDIFTQVCQTKRIQQLGLALFLGKLNQTTGELQYLAAGNLSIHHYRNQQLEPIEPHQGILYLYQPVDVSLKTLTLKSGECLLIHSDGVKLNESVISNLSGKSEINLNNLTEEIIQAFACVDDDALCCLLQKAE